MTVDGHTTQGIENFGYNPVTAIENGAFSRYVEERAAMDAGASFTGEGTNSSYRATIFSGAGMGLQKHVTAVQQGHFAALYQKLSIIPTGTDNIVGIPQGVAALVKAGAPPLAIENYFVQFDGYSWAAAAGSPLQSGS